MGNKLHFPRKTGCFAVFRLDSLCVDMSTSPASPDDPATEEALQQLFVEAEEDYKNMCA